MHKLRWMNDQVEFTHGTLSLLGLRMAVSASKYLAGDVYGEAQKGGDVRRDLAHVLGASLVLEALQDEKRDVSSKQYEGLFDCISMSPHNGRNYVE